MSGLLDSLEEAHLVIDAAQDVLKVADEGHWPKQLAEATSLAADWLTETHCEACDANGAIERDHDEPVETARDLKDVRLCGECNGQGALAGLYEVRTLVAELVEILTPAVRWSASEGTVAAKVERVAFLLSGSCPGCGGLGCPPTGCKHGKRSG